MEYYLSIKKNEIMPFAATCIDLEIVILSEVREIPYDIAYMWNQKNDICEHTNDTYLQHRNRLTD